MSSACDGTYECICDVCTAERIRRVNRGIRLSAPIPGTMGAAARVVRKSRPRPPQAQRGIDTRRGA